MTAAVDALGLCYFVGPTHNMFPIYAEALTSIYGIPVTPQELIIMGQKVVHLELAYNQRANPMLWAMENNDLPKWCRNPLPPTHSCYDVPKEELKSIWDDETIPESLK